MKEEMDKLIKEIYQIRLEMNYSAVKMSNDPELENTQEVENSKDEVLDKEIKTEALAEENTNNEIVATEEGEKLKLEDYEDTISDSKYFKNTNYAIV